jgi:hypothetical protein
VNATPGFQDAHKVADGASDLLTAVFGAKGSAARSTTTAPSLPFDIAFEADAIFLIR